MNETELRDHIYAEKLSKLQRKAMSGGLTDYQYEEEYEKERSRWELANLVERTKVLHNVF